MMRKVFQPLLCLLMLMSSAAIAKNAFTILPLGTSGGIFEDNLSSYLVLPAGTHHWLALDAGTVCSAIKQLPAAEQRKIQITDYFISHSHLDHISGLAICAPGNKPATIHATDDTIQQLNAHIFNNKIWPNFADEGAAPQIKLYHYHHLPLWGSVTLTTMPLTVQTFPLAHGNMTSTAFLLKHQNRYLLYFGDTGSDTQQQKSNLLHIWQTVAPLIRQHELTTMMIEVSYSNIQAPKQLYGHLTPALLSQELKILANLVNPDQPDNALSGLTIIVTHIKQTLNQPDQAPVIMQELQQENHFGAKFVLPHRLQKITV